MRKTADGVYLKKRSATKTWLLCMPDKMSESLPV